MLKLTAVILASALMITAFSVPAQAYIGPGPGLQFLDLFFTFASGVIATLVMILLWPVRMLKKKYKARNQPPDDSNPE